MTTFYPGTRVEVFDSSLFKDDVSTPLSITMQKGTVAKWYGKLQKDYGDGFKLGPYDSLIDVQLDRGKLSTGHFTDRVRIFNS